MTLKEWKSRFYAGQRLACVYRWYWDKGTPRMAGYKPTPEGGREIVTVTQVRATQLLYTGPRLKPGQNNYLDWPRASEVKHTHNGFELYFPSDPRWGDRSGILMSRYEYIEEACEQCGKPFMECEHRHPHDAAAGSYPVTV